MGLKQFLALEHVITEPSSASFKGATDIALEALGYSRRVVLSVSSFLVAAEIVAQTDLISIIPEGVIRDRGDRLQVFKPPLDIPDIELFLYWHQRTHNHAGHRWIRDALVASVS